MLDILLDEDEDIIVSDDGDISLTESPRQAAIIRLKWFSEEWRLGPDLGMPYWQEILVKNPSIIAIRRAVTKKLLEIDNVDSVSNVDVRIDRASRRGTISFTMVANEEVIAKEVEIYV